jgi:hypothetical protein
VELVHFFSRSEALVGPTWCVDELLLRYFTFPYSGLGSEPFGVTRHQSVAKPSSLEGDRAVTCDETDVLFSDG